MNPQGTAMSVAVILQIVLLMINFNYYFKKLIKKYFFLDGFYCIYTFSFLISLWIFCVVIPLKEDVLKSTQGQYTVMCVLCWWLKFSIMFVI